MWTVIAMTTHVGFTVNTHISERGARVEFAGVKMSGAYKGVYVYAPTGELFCFWTAGE